MPYNFLSLHSLQVYYTNIIRSIYLYSIPGDYEGIENCKAGLNIEILFLSRRYIKAKK